MVISEVVFLRTTVLSWIFTIIFVAVALFEVFRLILKFKDTLFKLKFR